MDSEGLGVAQTLCLKYTQLIQENRKEILQLYSPGANISWNGDQFTGIESIKLLYDQLPNVKLSPRGLDYQVIPSTNLCIVVAMIGIITIGKGNIGDFHMTFCVEADPSTRTAYIHSQAVFLN